MVKASRNLTTGDSVDVVGSARLGSMKTDKLKDCGFGLKTLWTIPLGKRVLGKCFHLEKSQLQLEGGFDRLERKPSRAESKYFQYFVSLAWRGLLYGESSSFRVRWCR